MLPLWPPVETAFVALCLVGAHRPVDLRQPPVTRRRPLARCPAGGADGEGARPRRSAAGAPRPGTGDPAGRWPTPAGGTPSRPASAVPGPAAPAASPRPPPAAP